MSFQLTTRPIAQNLRDAVLAKDYTGVLKSILLGVDINWADPEDSSRTAIHVLPFSGGTAAMLEFLLQNGGEVNAEDARFSPIPAHNNLCLRSQRANPLTRQQTNTATLRR